MKVLRQPVKSLSESQSNAINSTSIPFSFPKKRCLSYFFPPQKKKEAGRFGCRNHRYYF